MYLEQELHEMRTRESAQTKPSFVYTDIRLNIRDGDMLLFQGSKMLSRFIRWGSNSLYSHSGVAAWWENRLLVFQAGARGIEVLPMSSAVDAYDGQVDWYSLKEEHFGQVDRKALVNTAVELLGRSYAHKGLVNLAYRMALGRYRGLPDACESPDSMFCSQYVSYCYRLAGLDLVKDADDASTSPQDLAGSPYVILRGVLHANVQDKAKRKADAALPGKPRGQLKK